MGSSPSVESALVIVVPEAEALVKPFRDRHDPSAAAGVPAHITLLYPFLPGQVDESTHAGLRQYFARRDAFGFSLAGVRRFESPIPVLYLAPEPATHFAELTVGLNGLYPDMRPYGGKFADIVPHLTVAQATDVRQLDLIAEQFARASHGKLPIAATAREVALLDNQSGRWKTQALFALGRR